MMIEAEQREAEIRERLAEARQRLTVLQQERDEGFADAERQKAGMREVALFRAANAAACMGRWAWPLLEDASYLLDRIKLLEDVVEGHRGTCGKCERALASSEDSEVETK